ncbi:MAG: hydrogenase maturation nickel metallochaperone HypA [Lentisphaerae bacterium]|nr:hydrogenase maturation nickel metallochaperone HypA [Lentisphaerota bacterium]
MHELSLARALVEQVETIVRREGADAALAVTVSVGALSGVDREALEFAFPLASEGTSLAGCRLRVEETPVELSCDDCGQTTRPERMDMVCARCGSRGIRLTGGMDFLLRSVELGMREEGAAAGGPGRSDHV